MSRTKPNYLSAILSVALVLLLLGLFAVSALYGNGLVQLFKERVNLWIELKPDLPASEQERILSVVREQPFVKRESVAFTSREEAAEAMKQELGDESLIQDLPELMRDVVQFNVKAEFLAPDSLAEWRAQMKQDSAVADLFFEATNTGDAAQNIEHFGWLALGLAVLLIFAAITLIHNTIRLALYANRFLIRNQELVGASWGFITRPYLRRGLLNGLLSGLLAVAALLGILWFSRQAVPDIEKLRDPLGEALIGVGMVVLGVLISGISTWWVVNRFLRMRLDDLY